MGWSAGFTSNEPETVDTITFVEDETFRYALRFLRKHVMTILENMDESDNLREEYEVCLADINDIYNDPGIMTDPDQWEDLDFYVENGHFYVFEN